MKQYATHFGTCVTGQFLMIFDVKPLTIQLQPELEIWAIISLIKGTKRF